MHQNQMQKNNTAEGRELHCESACMLCQMHTQPETLAVVFQTHYVQECGDA